MGLNNRDNNVREEMKLLTHWGWDKTTELLPTYLKFHIFNNVDNTEIATRFMNQIIFRMWLFLMTFLYYA